MPLGSIQTVITQIISGQTYSIQLASGGYTENIVLSNQNYILSGVSCPLFAPTTAITGTITMGALNTLTTVCRKVIQKGIYTEPNKVFRFLQVGYVHFLLLSQNRLVL